MKNIYIIGCGGVCTYFMPSFMKMINYNKKLKSNTNIHLVDGDILEKKNFERQNFSSESYLDEYKSDALQDEYIQMYEGININSIKEYVSDAFPIESNSFIFCFVDNHPARKDVFTLADRNNSQCIFATNSTIGAHAYYYNHSWANTSLDPRIRYPEILTIETGSPIAATGCNTEKALNDVPQTAIANQFAATHAIFLWNFWEFESKTLAEDEYKKYWPVEVSNNFSRLNTIRIADLE